MRNLFVFYCLLNRSGSGIDVFAHDQVIARFDGEDFRADMLIFRKLPDGAHRQVVRDNHALEAEFFAQQGMNLRGKRSRQLRINAFDYDVCDQNGVGSVFDACLKGFQIHLVFFGKSSMGITGRAITGKVFQACGHVLFLNGADGFCNVISGCFRVLPDRAIIDETVLILTDVGNGCQVPVEAE